MVQHAIYLVGTQRRYKAYLVENGVPEAGFVFHAEGVRDVQDAPLSAQVIFLDGWQELPEWRELYNWEIVRRNTLRLIAEAVEEETWR